MQNKMEVYCNNARHVIYLYSVLSADVANIEKSKT